MLIAIEGGDGAGKATAAANVVAQLQTEGLSATVISFPRYADTLGGHVLGEFLSGRLPRAATPKAAAVLYALDRLESRDALLAADAAHDVLVFDRYIASNIAYQAAKVPEAEVAALIDWIVRLETEMFALPAPALTIYLDTPLEIARDLILRKHQRSYTDRAYDEHEADLALQARVRENYAALASEARLGPWMTVRTVEQGAMRAPHAIAAEITQAVLARR
ncbi:thymidylate kinase [Sphingomonas sp. RB3P16]|uniref:thymidylate kinase n=1 Tax=Parasphingomonas frigoris TaxID=3096163 RepID=UPI002FCC4B51